MFSRGAWFWHRATLAEKALAFPMHPNPLYSSLSKIYLGHTNVNVQYAAEPIALKCVSQNTDSHQGASEFGCHKQGLRLTDFYSDKEHLGAEEACVWLTRLVFDRGKESLDAPRGFDRCQAAILSIDG